MKKLLSLLLALAMIFSFAACGSKEETGKQPIVILGPMDCEYSVLADSLDNPKISKEGCYDFVEGTVDGYPVVVVHSYVGFANAAAVTTLAIDRYNPLCVIIQGTAGGHDPELHQRDIVLGENILDTGSYFSPHRDEGTGMDPFAWELPGDEVLVNGEMVREFSLHSDEELMKIAESVPYAGGKLVRGNISSATVWNKEIDYINFQHETYGSAGEEMEGYAVAQICANFGVKCLCIRIISNSELHPDEIFDEVIAEDCQRYCLDVVKKIAGGVN